MDEPLLDMILRYLRDMADRGDNEAKIIINLLEKSR